MQYRKKLKSLMKSGEYNYVHCNCLAVANIDIAKYAYKYGKTKVIIHSHQDMKLRHLKSEILHRYNRNWLKNKDIIRLACSEQAARWIHGDSVTEKGKVIYIHNAIEVDNFKYEQEVEKKYRKEFGLENKFVVGCVGRFAYQKNYEFLAEIFSEIRKKNKTAVLVCVGDEGGMKEIVLEKFKKLKVMDSLRLLGIREDVAQIMQMFDVFVLPSRWEGLGIVYIEAQAAGVQTFASDVVPKEAKVTELLHYISLKKSPEVWAREILKYENGYVKRDTTEEIKKKGYFRRYFYAVYSRIFRNSMLRYKYVYQPFLQNIEKETIYLSVGGDHYCYGTYSNHIYDFLNDNVLKNGGKSVLWSCSIEEKDLDKRTINSLKQYDLITARESITYQMLLRKGINKNVVLIPDVAFQLSSVKVELPEMLIKGKTIGINISPMIQKYGENGQRVLENYEKLIEFILSETDCTIALIPHVVWNDTDDRIPLTELYKKYKETNRIVLIQDRSAEELKSIIAQCCFFVGARTHATIAAYSSCVPTLVVGYSVKARGIARDIFGTEEEYVIAVQSMKDTFALKRAFEKLWGKKNEIRENLNRTMPQYCEEVLKAKKILETVCESERK